MIAGIITRGNLLIKNCIAQHLEPVINKLHEIGVDISCKDNCIRVVANDPLKPADIRTAPFPDFHRRTAFNDVVLGYRSGNKRYHRGHSSR